jgi:hypothetical protein
MESAMTREQKSDRNARSWRAALAFAFGGLSSGLTLLAVVSFKVFDFSGLPAGIPGKFPVCDLWPGVFLLVGLELALLICSANRWIRIEASSTRRVMVSMLLVISTGFFFLTAVLVAAIATDFMFPFWLINADQGRRPTAHVAILVVVPIAFGLIVLASLLASALSIVTNKQYGAAWGAMMISIPPIVAATILSHPGYLTAARLASDLKTANRTFLPIYVTLHLLAFPVFAGCMGYWLARHSPHEAEPVDSLSAP